jgi:hypothetical protein
LRYTAPDPEPLVGVATDGLLADGPIGLLAADGVRVAFESCDRIYVWTPAAKLIDPPFEPKCEYPDLTGRLIYYDLALAGDRLLYALNVGCMSITLTLNLRILPGRSDAVIDRSFGNCGNAFNPALGGLAGSGDLLVYGEWREKYVPPPPGGPYGYPSRYAAVHRVDGAACPCPVVASTNGPLYAADVNDGRFVAYGDNATLVIDRDGNRLLSLPVSPAAAQLSRNHLVLLMRGQLRDYDVRSAELLHAWPLLDVPTGPVCGWRICNNNQLVLADAANGLVAYVLDGDVHLLRLANGADTVVGPGSLARFMDLGLVYADGARIHLVPYRMFDVQTHR